MDQVVDRRETETCAKRTLGSILRTGALLAAAAFASVLAVDLPIPAGRAGAGTAQPYVPASDTWIELGVPQRPAGLPGSDRPQADLLRAAAVASPAAQARGREQRQSRRKPRGIQVAALPGTSRARRSSARP